MQASDGTSQSAAIVKLDVTGTTVFVITAVLAAAVFNDSFKVVGVVVSLLLFAIGVFTFLWSYWTAVQRSRTDDIAVAQLYFLAGGAAPKEIKRTMNGLLLVQAVVALATAIARSSTDGRAGSTLAFGILVPMFGLGLNGLWCARYGRFNQRQVGPGAEAPPEPSVPPSADEMEQNSTHG